MWRLETHLECADFKAFEELRLSLHQSKHGFVRKALLFITGPGRAAFEEWLKKESPK